jgi:hypothetical protein
MTSAVAPSPHLGAAAEGFTGQVVKHPLLSEATNEIEEFIADPVARRIALLVGPSGVGKSTLKARVIEGIQTRRSNELDEHPERTAVLTTSVPSGQKVSMKWFYATLLDELEAPLTWRKIDPAVNRQQLRHQIHRATEAGLRSALLEEIERKRPTALIFDEADHFTRGRRSPELSVLADAFKDLSEQTEVPLVLIGTYVLLGFRALSAQFDRRTRLVHLRPYRFDDREDRLTFTWAVHQLASRLPVPQPELAEDIEMIYERTLGCIGNVYEWFALSLRKAHADNCERIEPRHLEACRMPLASLEGARVEIMGGMAKLREDADLLDRYRREIGLTPSGMIRPGVARSRKRPGKRGAHRDKVNGH